MTNYKITNAKNEVIGTTTDHECRVPFTSNAFRLLLKKLGLKAEDVKHANNTPYNKYYIQADSSNGFGELIVEVK